MESSILIVAVAISAVLSFWFVSSSFKSKKRGANTLMDTAREQYHESMLTNRMLNRFESIAELNELADELGIDRDDINAELDNITNLIHGGNTTKAKGA